MLNINYRIRFSYSQLSMSYSPRNVFQKPTRGIQFPLQAPSNSDNNEEKLWCLEFTLEKEIKISCYHHPVI